MPFVLCSVPALVMVRTPPWAYHGFDQFPALFFGANSSGLESGTQLEAVSRFQLAGWGWQQDTDSVPSTYDGHYYSEELRMAQMATRMEAFLEFTGRPPSPLFVYRHTQMALSWFALQEAAFRNPLNADLFLHDQQGRLCFDNYWGGPSWNWSNPRAVDFWVDEIVGELASESSISAVFFDETDAFNCNPGPQVSNCTLGQLWVDLELPGMARAKLQAMRRTAERLNAHGIWPMISMINGFEGNVLDSQKKCLVPFNETWDALQSVGWMRFYEFGVASPAALRQALRERELGLPTVVHAWIDAPANGSAAVTLHTACFLLQQANYSYFGASQSWVEPGSTTWPKEYELSCRAPLGPPAFDESTGWTREFEGCTVRVDANVTVGQIAVK